MRLIEHKYIYRFKILTAISAMLFVILVLLMSAEPAWKTYQASFASMIRKNQDSVQTTVRTGIHQIEIRGTGHVDRCLTCHMAIDAGTGKNFPLPFADHPPGILSHHDLGQFACTLCHAGKGRSLVYDETCNPLTVSDWKPIQSNCSQCHLAVFDSQAAGFLPETVLQGLDLFYASGCLGCHKLRDTGGRFGPDLTRIGEKKRQDYDFKHISGEKTINNWHLQHFSDPAAVSPGSIMPVFTFNDQQRQLLTTFVLGLSRPRLPFTYYDMNVLKEFKGQRALIDSGRAFSLICSACHGDKGQGRSFKNHIFGVPSLANQDFQAIASTAFIALITEEGRSNRYMPSWKSKHSGLYQAEVNELIHHVRAFRMRAPSFDQVRRSAFDRSAGRLIYLDHCSTCHGTDRQGGIGPSLNNDTFTRLASDIFLYETLTSGRANTAMPSWSRLDARSLKSLIRFIQPEEKTLNEQKNKYSDARMLERGEEIYHYQCSRCHGEDGQGGIGPAILKKDFLKAAGDTFIRGMISRGRSHTPMFAMTLSDAALDSLLQFMRSKQNSLVEYIDPGPTLGNMAGGKSLYNKYCKKCHGEKGEGIEAPALNNQEFLNAASNGYLLATITMGRLNTPMPAWGKNREGQRALTSEERQDLTAFIRHWQILKIKYRPLSMSSQN
jgi:mono/diheme cytochrome c family protein